MGPGADPRPTLRQRHRRLDALLQQPRHLMIQGDHTIGTFTACSLL